LGGWEVDPPPRNGPMAMYWHGSAYGRHEVFPDRRDQSENGAFPRPRWCPLEHRFAFSVLADVGRGRHHSLSSAAGSHYSSGFDTKPVPEREARSLSSTFGPKSRRGQHRNHVFLSNRGASYPPRVVEPSVRTRCSPMFRQLPRRRYHVAVPSRRAAQVSPTAARLRDRRFRGPSTTRSAPAEASNGQARPAPNISPRPFGRRLGAIAAPPPHVALGTYFAGWRRVDRPALVLRSVCRGPLPLISTGIPFRGAGIRHVSPTSRSMPSFTSAVHPERSWRGDDFLAIHPAPTTKRLLAASPSKKRSRLRRHRRPGVLFAASRGMPCWDFTVGSASFLVRRGRIDPVLSPMHASTSTLLPFSSGCSARGS